MCANIILLTFWKEEIEEVIWVMIGVPRYSDEFFAKSVLCSQKNPHPYAVPTGPSQPQKLN